MNNIKLVMLSAIASLLFTCNSPSVNEVDSEIENEIQDVEFGVFQAESFDLSSINELKRDETIVLGADEWLAYTIDVPATGRYQIEINMSGEEGSSVWFEDYINNKDGRTYDISGKIKNNTASSLTTLSKYGSPLRAGKHEIKVHASGGKVEIDWFKLTLFKDHFESSTQFTQNMVGEEWSLVWSDEFEGSGLPDTSKWNYNIGDWGWGNNEPQYYTELRPENARQEDGNLIIQAIKNDQGYEWTSARLTTQGKESFLYGKIEFRAKVPVGRGTWSAGWLLGDDFKDELSWPYCGEIDVLECVGYEIDDETGDGKNHATCHTRAYYFKQNNQIGSVKDVKNMNGEFHTYAIEWYPDVIYGVMDGERYYTYDKTADELEWPFFKAQNIILNLAVGGGWGGAQGIDEKWDSHEFIIDYVRVYELK